MYSMYSMITLTVTLRCYVGTRGPLSPLRVTKRPVFTLVAELFRLILATAVLFQGWLRAGFPQQLGTILFFRHGDVLVVLAASRPRR